jgi:hypothetical protein
MIYSCAASILITAYSEKELVLTGGPQTPKPGRNDQMKKIYLLAINPVTGKSDLVKNCAGKSWTQCVCPESIMSAPAVCFLVSFGW